MENLQTMLAKDTLSAKMARAFITTREGERYLLFQAKTLEATLEKEKEEVAILGRMQKGHKSVSMKGSGTMTIYKNTALFDEMMLRLVNEGIDTYFDLQVENEDPTSDAGGRVVILTGCNIDKTTVASYDADGKLLEDEIGFTFEGVKIPKNFRMLDGMQA
ncbi:MAG: phage tail tube protein [Negativicoccus massiliensis]|jgi:hypothetical protein|uniref:phage tail tube protein n=1 Tax=Negativicoccus succinicivorans TaxID=620903 RepID=UPI0023556A39|nr:phage tail tube protein [Negativicoccus succinicivorans]MDU4641292.1 phage tail tube protein [Negativicoccus massiliensis]MBS5890664.1 phage tail tube protein [Negativicoccus succinicivorans]MDU2418268.1 phage tail tube protein [Negativicoccus succinicivorans]MDU5287640.1 phage tail tube protein [Negativicoccus succinicivorans]MDU5530358.1 phage tail tube protein [Negativicoccus succinicivorans]